MKPYDDVLPTDIQLHVARRAQSGDVISGKSEVNIARIMPVGSCAVQLHFDDGHDTGI